MVGVENEGMTKLCTSLNLQFSLRAMLLLLTMIACFFAGWKARDLSDNPSRRVVSINGVVLSAIEGNYVLSVGSDDGVRVGTVVSVHRAGEPLGEIVTIGVNPDDSFGMRKQPTWLAKATSDRPTAGDIRQGDSVSFTFSINESRRTSEQNGYLRLHH